MSAPNHGPVLTELASINIESGVSAFTGEPFCRIEAVSSAGAIWFGQLSPDEVRGMALQWLEVACGAEQDAIVRKVMVESGAEEEAAGALILLMRAARSAG